MTHKESERPCEDETGTGVIGHEPRQRSPAAAELEAGPGAGLPWGLLASRPGRIHLCCFQPLLYGCYYCSPRTMVFQAETTPDLRSPHPHPTPRPQAQTPDIWGPCASQAGVWSVPLRWHFPDPPLSLAAFVSQPGWSLLVYQTPFL